MRRLRKVQLISICIIAILLTSFAFAQNTAQNNSDLNSSNSVVEIYDNTSGISGIYVQLTDEDDQEVAADTQIIFGNRTQFPLIENENVKWAQNITIVNNIDYAQEITINLWAHETTLNRSFLWDIVQMQTVRDGEVISQTPVSTIIVEPRSQVVLENTYYTPAVTVEEICWQRTIADLIPIDAIIVSADLSLNTVIESRCENRIVYQDRTRFREVEMVLNDSTVLSNGTLAEPVIEPLVSNQTPLSEGNISEN